MIVSGTGEVIEPDDGIAAVGSGGNYAHGRRARPLGEHRSFRATKSPKRRCISPRISACSPTHNVIVEDGLSMDELTPKQVVRELDRYIIGQDEAKRAVAVALRNRYRRAQLPEEIRDEIVPKNILMVGPTGVGKTEIARRLARLVDAPFVKVEATKFTEVGYVGRDVEIHHPRSG